MRIRILRFITALVSTGAIFFAVEVCGLSHRYFFLGLAVCLESLTLLASRVGVVSPWVFHLEGLALPVLLALAVGKLAGKAGRRVVAGAALGVVCLTQVAVVPLSVGDERIVIEKSRFLLTVYRGGSEVLQIEVGLGPNSGAKQMIDDGRTPEGTYRVCSKEAPRDEYWLGLNYPNSSDAWRGRRQGLISWVETWVILVQNRNGKVPLQRTALGNGIGIHQGPHFTAGSIGASPADLARLYPLINAGCPVEIRP